MSTDLSAVRAWDFPDGAGPGTAAEFQVLAEIEEHAAGWLREPASAGEKAWGVLRAAAAGRLMERRREELQNGAITYGGHTMRLHIEKVGVKPAVGYPLFIALHGGGGCPVPVNDQQFDHMKTYYKHSVECGVYVACRGITNDWNLHWRDESWAMYERLVENMVLFEGVDANRVYVMGFSAGGDGTYRIAAGMPDRLAAANMSAGHPNGQACDNYAQLGFVLQCGEKDGAYDRNKIAAEYGLKLQALSQAHPGMYRHACYIHKQKPHNFADNNPARVPQSVVCAGDLARVHRGEGTPAYEDANTNAVDLVTRFVRDPHPTALRYRPGDLPQHRNAPHEPGFGATRHRGLYYYNLSMARFAAHQAWVASTCPAATPPGDAPGRGGVIEATFDRGGNAAALALPDDATFLRVHLNHTLADPARPYEVVVNGVSLGRKPFPSARPDVLFHTLIDRGDPCFVYPYEIVLSRDAAGAWHSYHEAALLAPTQHTPVPARSQSAVAASAPKDATQTHASFDVPSIKDALSTDDLRYVAGKEHVMQVAASVKAVRATAAVFQDQGWGNAKGHVFLVVKRGGDVACQLSLFGTARLEAPTANAEKCSENPCEVRPGDVLCIAYRVGGGGGHTLEVQNLRIEVEW